MYKFKSQENVIGVDLGAYRDSRYNGTPTDQEEQLLRSTTLYIGNLGYHTTEEQTFEVFSRAGDVKRVVMGLDRFKKTPAGFCFVEYYTREDSENAMRYINGMRLDDRIIRCDWDAGFVDGRQWGRGRHGGQIRDEFRRDYDPDRGGWNRQLQTKGPPGQGQGNGNA